MHVGLNNLVVQIESRSAEQLARVGGLVFEHVGTQQVETVDDHVGRQRDEDRKREEILDSHYLQLQRNTPLM